MHMLSILNWLAVSLAWAQAAQAGADQQQTKTELPECEWCGADEAPAKLDWQTTIAGNDEPGERLVISGTLREADGKNAAAGVVLYLYHTNSKGIYPRRGDETGNARRHGHLRAWLRTNDKGQYEFNTIRPGPYPGRDSPAHIHVTVKEQSKPEYWLDSFMFEGDPRITPQYRATRDNIGGSGIVSLKRDERATWRGQRDIVLPR